MRTNIGFKLLCANCGSPLEACSKQSKINYGSAYEAECQMKIIPCNHCMSEAEKPARLIKQALRSFA